MMRNARRTFAAALVVVAMGATAACGDKKPKTVAPPVKVPVELAPQQLKSQLSVNEDNQARDKFAHVGNKALIADGRLWALRQGQVLVGALQISTVKPKVDLLRSSNRNSIASSILPGSKETINVNGVDIIKSASNDKTVFVWFGRDLFEVLQVKTGKDGKVKPDDVLNDIVQYQISTKVWKPLPAAAEDDAAT